MRRGLCLLLGAVLGGLISACSEDPPTAGDLAVEHKATALMTEERFQAPAGWQWDHLTNADGARLRYGHAEPGGQARGVIIITPGYASPAEEFFEVARDFLHAGYAVWILDRRGQGGSDRWPDLGQRAYLTSLATETRDLDQFSALVKAKAQGAPLFLVGESLGGLIGIGLLHDDPEAFRAAAFSSPAIDFQTGSLPKGGVRMLTSFLTEIGFGTSYAPGQHDWRFNPDTGGPNDPAFDDRERALAHDGWLLAHPAFREGGATNGFVHSLFLAADTEEAPGWAARITTPVLIGMTPGDKIAEPSAMVTACGAMRDCRLDKYLGAKHALFNDRDATRTKWMKAVIAFFDEHSNADATEVRR
jgi:lysophospholipase